MTGRRAAIGLSLLCALLFSAFAAQGAAAAGTTAFTCEPTVAGGAGFSDAHCDNAVASGATFKHSEITPGTATEVHVSNKNTASATTAATTAVLSIENFHGFALVEIKCNEVTSEGGATKNFLTNNNNGGGAMSVSGRIKLKVSNSGVATCPVSGVTNCTTATISPVEAEGTSFGNATEMGTELKPVAPATTFATVTLNGTCAIHGTAFPVEGSVKSTAHGEPLGQGATCIVIANLAMSGLLKVASIAAGLTVITQRQWALAAA